MIEPMAKPVEPWQLDGMSALIGALLGAAAGGVAGYLLKGSKDEDE
jgi:hypothetical protein